MDSFFPRLFFWNSQIRPGVSNVEVGERFQMHSKEIGTFYLLGRALRIESLKAFRTATMK